MLRLFLASPWFIWGLGTTFYMYQFVLRASPNVMADHLRQAFQINASSLGILASCYYLAYTLLQIPLGHFLDKWGAKRILRYAVITCTLGVFIFSFSDGFWLACGARFIIGLGASGAFLSTIALTRDWIPPSQVTFAIGTTIALGKLGGMLSNLPLALLIRSQGWRCSLLILACFGCLLTILIWLFVHSKKQPPSDDHIGSEKGVRKLFNMMRHRHIWHIALYGCLTYVPLSVFTDTWGVLFLMKKHHVSKELASLAISFVFIGTSIGAPLIALLSERLEQRRLLMTLSALGSLVVGILFVLGSYESFQISVVLCFLMGALLTGQTLVFTVSAESMPKPISGLVTGFVNTIVMMGGIFFQPMVGFIMDFFWNGITENGLAVYSLDTFKLGLLVIPISMGIAFLSTLFIPETHPKKSDKVIFP